MNGRAGLVDNIEIPEPSNVDSLDLSILGRGHLFKRLITFYISLFILLVVVSNIQSIFQIPILQVKLLKYHYKKELVCLHFNSHSHSTGITNNFVRASGNRYIKPYNCTNRTKQIGW